MIWLQEASAAITEVVVVSERDVFGDYSVVKPVDVVDVNAGTSEIRTADLISRLPGVDLNGQAGSLQTYSIRGFSRARIQTLVAGVPLHTERRAGNSATFIDSFLIQHIAVIKGPASTLYGSGAIGGIVSLSPRIFQGPVFSGSLYTQGEQKMFGAGWGNGQLSAGIAYRKHRRSDDVENNQLNDAMERISGSLNWVKDFSDFSLSSKAVISRGENIGKSSADFPDDRITHYPTEDHILGSIQLESEDWLVDAYLHEQALDTSVSRPGRSTNNTNSDSTDYGGSIVRGWHDLNSSYRLGLDLDIRRNVEVEESTAGQAAQFSFLSLAGSQIETAFIADGQWRNSALTVNAGLRYARIEQENHDESQSDAAWTGMAAISYDFSQSWNTFLQIGSGYRFPELTEKFFNGITGRGVIVGSPDLDAEHSVSSEVGVIGEFASFRIQSSIYYTRVSNYIERIEISDRLFTFQNLQDGTIKGAELSMKQELNPVWELEVTGHWMEGVNDKNQYLADMSPSRVSLTLISKRSWGEFLLDYRHRYQSSRVHVDELPTDHYNRLLARVSINIGNSSDVAIWAENILDDDFRMTSDSLSPQSTGYGLGLALTWTH